MDEKRLVVGSISHDAGGVRNSGAAYVFARDHNDAWGLETKLLSPVPAVQGTLSVKKKVGKK